jgi:hypothetical protein
VTKGCYSTIGGTQEWAILLPTTPIGASIITLKHFIFSGLNHSDNFCSGTQKHHRAFGAGGPAPWLQFFSQHLRACICNAVIDRPECHAGVTGSHIPIFGLLGITFGAMQVGGGLHGSESAVAESRGMRSVN